ncbi:MAG: heparinase II/III family protein, partial [Bacteroidales bacterium]|nr:heparinase II/III family protein [Bacteroidales bacterium]
MKHGFFYAFLCVVLLWGCAKQIPDGPQPPEEEPDGGSHPTLFADRAAFAAYREKLAATEADAPLRQFHDIAMQYADDVLSGKDKAPAYTLDASALRILTTASAPAERQLLACSYAYRLTGDARYLDKAAELLRLVCGFADWNAYRHMLDAAEMAVGVAVAYDWLYEELDEETRALARQGLYSFVLAPHLAAYRADGVYASGHVSKNYLEATNNWNQVCCAGVTIAALALREEYPEETQRIVDQCVRSVKAQTPAMYGAMGNYPEGPGYWAYGTGCQCIMAAALASATGSDEGVASVTGMAKTPQYQLYMDDLSVSQQFNYCDAGAAMSIGLPMFFFAAYWEMPSYLYHELQKKDLYASNKYGGRLFPLFLICSAGLDWEGITPPEGCLYQGSGVQPVCVARTGWTGLPSDRYLGIKAGTAYASHAHMDVGSFVYDAGGVRWSCDPGNTSYTSYEASAPAKAGAPIGSSQQSLRWWMNLYNNKHHSTLSCADADGNPYFHKVGTNVARASLSTVQTEESLGATVDFAGNGTLSTWLSACTRTLTIEAQDYLQCVDALQAGAADCNIQWRMCTGAAVTVEPGRIRLEQDGQTA